MIPLLFCFGCPRSFESLTEKYRSLLETNSSVSTEEQVILESLAALGRQIDKSVTADEVTSEINSKMCEILDQVTQADATLRQDFEEIRAEFQATREAVPQLINDARSQILRDIGEFQARLNRSLRTLAESAAIAEENWMDLSMDNLRELSEFLGSRSLLPSVIFFILVQVAIAHGILHIRQVNRYLRHRAKPALAQSSDGYSGDAPTLT